MICCYKKSSSKTALIKYCKLPAWNILFHINLHKWLHEVWSQTVFSLKMEPWGCASISPNWSLELLTKLVEHQALLTLSKCLTLPFTLPSLISESNSADVSLSAVKLTASTTCFQSACRLWAVVHLSASQRSSAAKPHLHKTFIFISGFLHASTLS